MTLFPLSSILVNGRKRHANPDKVATLAESIHQLGLLNPLTITSDGRLIAGLHRLEAVKQLGWLEVPVHIVTLDALMAELAEIDENLIRHELDELQESVQIFRRKQIYETLYPQTRNGANGRRGSGNGAMISRNDKLTFSEDTADKMSKSRRVVERKVLIGAALYDSSYRLEDSPIRRNQRALLTLAQMDEQEREEVIEKLETREALTIQEAQRLIHQEEQTTMPDDIPSDLIERCQFYCSEFDENNLAEEVEDHSIDAIITTLPNKPELYQTLAVVASRVLKPGGSLLCAVDQVLLFDALDGLSRDLSYRWTLALIPEHPPATIAPDRINTAWKPVLWFTKGARVGGWVDDTAKTMSDLVERFTVPGQTIFDPFMRSGYIVVPAVQMNRKVVGIGSLDALETVLKRLRAIQEGTS